MSDWSLSEWYAEPLSESQALDKLEHIRLQLRQPKNHQRLYLRLQEIIAKYWLGRDIENDISNLLATCDHDRDRALIHLIHGQLLISQKRQGAFASLQTALQMGSPYFESADYLQVMRRHEVLRKLVLSKHPARPAGLSELLDEARVIARLEGPEAESRRLKSDPKDTTG